MSSGGGGSSAPTHQTITQTNVPDYLAPYVQQNVGQAFGLVNSALREGYQPYGNERVAGFNPLQIGGINHVLNQQSQLQGSTSAPITSVKQAGAGGAGGGSMTAAQSDFSLWDQLEDLHMGPIDDIGTSQWSQEAAQEYMSPYMQSVVDIQRREAARDADIMDQQRAAQLARAGAFGGGRQAIIQAEADRNRGYLMDDIQAQGSQRAYEQAMAQFNQDQARQLQADATNQGMAFNVGQANLSSDIDRRNLGAGAELTREMANLGNLQEAEALNLQSRTQSSIANMQAAAQASALNAQLDLQRQIHNDTFGLANRQFESNYGLNLLDRQMQYGNQAQAWEQSKLDMAYNDYLNQQRHPYEQVGFMSDILRGTPTATNYATTQPAPNPYSQLLGSGIGALGMYNALS